MNKKVKKNEKILKVEMKVGSDRIRADYPGPTRDANSNKVITRTLL